MVRATSPATWQTGSRLKAWDIFVALLAIRKPKARERWLQTLKNRILLENYYLPGDLEASIARFVDHYNHRRYHESLNNLTPADVYLGRGQTILLNRERIKRNTIQNRRLLQQNKAA